MADGVVNLAIGANNTREICGYSIGKQSTVAGINTNRTQILIFTAQHSNN